MCSHRCSPRHPKTTYDTIRWGLIGSKRTLAECATDAVIPNLLAIDRQKVLKQVQAAKQ
jgi:hypothetical protein